MTKMTNSVALSVALEVLSAKAEYKEVCEKLTNIKASIDKKASYKSDKPTKNQAENVGYKEAILAYLADGKQCTITEMMKGIEALAELSNQRVSAIVRQLKEDGFLHREEIKRKAYFSLASDEVEGE